MRQVLSAGRRILAGLLIRLLSDRTLSRFSVHVFTWTNLPWHKRLFAALLLPELSRTMYSGGEQAVAVANRELFWGGPAGKVWHDAQTSDFSRDDKVRESFIEIRLPLIESLDSLLSASRLGPTASSAESGPEMGGFYNSLPLGTQAFPESSV